MKKVSQTSLLLFFLFCHTIFAQQSSIIDSLNNVFNNSKADSTRINTLNLIAWETSKTDPAKAMEYALQALGMTEKLSNENKNDNYIKQKLIADAYHQIAWAHFVNNDYTSSLEYNLKALHKRDSLKYNLAIASSLNNIGNIYRIRGDYEKTLDYYLKALALFQENGDKIKISTALGNIGIVYYNLGDFPKSLDYYYKALKIEEASENKPGIARNLGNIGLVYKDQGDYAKSLDYYFKAIKIDEEIGNVRGVANHLGNIGVVYRRQADFNKALEYYFKALNIYEDAGNTEGISRQFSNIGIIYAEQNDNTKALYYFFKALEINERLGNKAEIAIKYINIGSLFTRSKKYDEAEQYLEKGLTIAREIGAKNVIKDTYDFWVTLDSVQGDYKRMIQHYRLYNLYKDSLFNEENTKRTVQAEMNYEFEKKISLEKVEQEKKDAIAIKEFQKQKLIKNIIIGSVIMLMFLGYLLFSRFKLIKKLEKQQAINKERHRISADLHDDIGSGLSKISLLSELIKRESQEQNVQSGSEKISATLKEISGNLSEIIWALNSKNDYLENLIAYIRRYAAEYFEDSKVVLKISTPNQIPYISVTSEQRRNIFFVVKEALHNIVKHANATEAELNFILKDDRLTVTIHDNGIGFHTGDQNRFGNGIKNMQNRTESIIGTFSMENHNGTKVIMELPI